MKPKPSTLPQAYLEALRNDLASRRSSHGVARSLGRRALDQRLDTLDLAKIHENALSMLLAGDLRATEKESMIVRGTSFFSSAIAPIEESHRGMQKANLQLKTLVGTLKRQTGELAASNKSLKREIIQRKRVELTLRTSEMTSCQLLAKSRIMQQELRHLTRQMLTAQEEERKRISRELHDVVAQSLAGINVRLATLKSQSSASTRDLKKRVAITQRLVERSVDIVHRFARGLRPSALDDLGLIPALQSYMKAFMTRTGIRASLVCHPGVEKLDNDRRTVLYRIVQEALTNISRHSKASHASVSIRLVLGEVQMDVHDNGRGFHVEGTVLSKSSKGLGLLGMRERAEMVGGTLAVISTPGSETTVRVRMPAKSKLKAGKKRPSMMASKPTRGPER